ncbi:PREDICTED: disease resistance protein RPS4-like [Tarenaya hassleriana]|uniref:disease resistance protein RPS4-like n=1 Tax=Tarenaya hassleriana TaxID=28532 RepID=UPI00053C1939|nr:PREDICTED: disease resistance protein RPS4-like [Tarenaya hassleriana]
MAASSSSLAVPQHKVFINFRGEEVRNNFVAHLDRTLKSAGINAFVDGDDGVGKDIDDLFERIEESRVALAVFSSKYTTSKWCLNELVKIKERVDEGQLVVIPIFYKVEPYTVKGLKGEFGEQFWELVRSNLDKARTWKEALEFVPRKRGLSYDGKSNEREFIDLMTKNVEQVLLKIPEEAEAARVIGPQETANPEISLVMMEQIHSRCIFRNHNDLDQAVKDKIASCAQRESQDFVSDSLLCTRFPGREVPSWFHQKAIGSGLKPKLPPRWCDKRLCGIALCAVVSFQGTQDQTGRVIVKCTCKFKTEDGSCTNFSWNVGDWTEPGKVEQPDHVFVGYTSRSHITKRLEEKGSSGSIPTEALLEFIVTDDDTTEVVRKYGEVVKCGFSLVYVESENVSCERNSYEGTNDRSDSSSQRMSPVGRASFMIYARDLSIEWSESKKRWTWISVKENPNDEAIEVAKLIEVYWLDITGRFMMSDLTKGTTYEVVFVVKIQDPAEGWHVPVNVKLTLPTGENPERKVNLRTQTRGRWLEIPAGEFVTPENDDDGYVEFSMYEHNTTDTPKKGLFVKGVAIRTKIQ